MADLPVVVVFSSLFPSPAQPGAGVFIRERMFRVGSQMPLVVVSPRPWFPLQGIIRYFRPHFRPEIPRYQKMDDVDVYYPRYLSFPGIFKGLDGWLMARGASAIIKRLAAERGVSLIDAHFAYPDGYAAAQLAKQLDVPVTVTLRGTEWRQCRGPLRSKVKQTLQQVSQIFSVSDSLKQVAVGLGIASDKIDVIGNGVDAEKFSPIDQDQARQRYGLSADAKVLITVGGLVERKGFHRVIDAMPELLQQQPNLHYLIIGGASAEGNIESQLREQVKRLGLDKNVHFLGTMPPDELQWPLSAADVFVLSTRNEGWANVILEAMACGLPVIATDVGGNAEVVNQPQLGMIIPFDDHAALVAALNHALQQAWDKSKIIRYAQDNSWDSRVERIVEHFTRLTRQG